ncbi:MAG: YaiI/YqxD family protein [Actinomycetota bacterium]|nr:YaiI/YqxD family protein [Actinomycetota bacterium]
MHIWVDADACPHVIKDLLYRAANRLKIALTLVANQPLSTPPSPYITVLRVPAGFDVADHTIVQQVRAGDLVVTADIPLAAQVVAKGAHALNPRGQCYTPENIHEHLTMRHVMDELRQSGVQTGGPSPFSRRDRQAFANQLDRFLTQSAQAESDATR